MVSQLRTSYSLSFFLIFLKPMEFADFGYLHIITSCPSSSTGGHHLSWKSVPSFDEEVGTGGSRGPSFFSGTCAFPLTLSGFFSFGSESLSETSVHLKAEPRFEPSPMVQPTGPLAPFGFACSHDISAGDTKNPSLNGQARRHISMM